MVGDDDYVCPVLCACGVACCVWLLEQDVPGEVALAHPHLYDETRLQTDG
jgi:hypothetical protein